MAWFRRRKPASSAGSQRASRDDLEHLRQFVQTRRGVEGFIEPRTTVTETTLLMVAHDGEWTRRRVAGPDTARRFGNGLGVPVYEVALVGYPRRMREYNERNKRAKGEPSAS
jgi:hypothetical protein